MRSGDPFEAPGADPARWRFRLHVAALAAGGLLVAVGAVHVGGWVLVRAGPLHLVALAGILGASAAVSAALRQRFAITRSETATGLAGFAMIHAVVYVAAVSDRVVDGRMNLLQVAIALVGVSAVAAVGAGIGRRLSRGSTPPGGEPRTRT